MSGKLPGETRQHTRATAVAATAIAAFAAMVALVVAVLLAGVAGTGVLGAQTAYADEMLDQTRLGSIDVTIQSTDGKPVGGQLSLYKVADAVADDTGWHLAWTDAYSSMDDDIYGQTGKLSDAYNKNLASKLAAVATSPLSTATVDSTGKASFSGLRVGMYLVVQTQASDGYDVIDPFVVTVPVQDETTGALAYDVNASPKAGVATATPVPSSQKTTTTPTPTRQTAQTPASASKLPQTGQLWWPVWILGAAGVALIVAGAAWRRHARRD